MQQERLVWQIQGLRAVLCHEIGSLTFISGLRAVPCHEVGSLAFVAGLGAVPCHEAFIPACAVIPGPVRTARRVPRVIAAACWM